MQLIIIISLLSSLIDATDPVPVNPIVAVVCGLGTTINTKTNTCYSCTTGATHCTLLSDGITTTATACDPSQWILENGLCVYVPATTVPCVAGFSRDSLSKNCVICPTNHFSPGEVACTSCISIGVSTCGPTTNYANECSNGYVLNNGTCRPIATHAAVPLVAPVHKACKVGTVAVEHNPTTCVSCTIAGAGIYSCSGTSPNNVVVTSCQHGFFYNKNHGCSICPDFKGSIQGNTATSCTSCRSAAVKCNTSGPGTDLSCQSNYYLKKGICSTCAAGSGSTYDNSNLSCQTCGVIGAKGCNLNVHPTLITSCTSKYVYSITNHVGICTLITH